MWDFTELPGTYLGSITEYEGQGYNHAGYPTEDGNYYVMSDETHGSPLKILDVSDPTDIEVVATMTSGVHNLSIAHNQIIHGNRMYSAFYYDGIYVWGIENPEEPELLGYFDTSTIPHRSSFEGAWGVYPFLPSGNILVSDMQTGLWVLGMDPELSTNNSEKPAISIWPNPVSEVLKITEGGGKHAQFTIMSMQGKKLSSGVLNTTEIDVSALPKGIYVLSVENEKGQISVKKFVKN